MCRMGVACGCFFEYSRVLGRMGCVHWGLDFLDSKWAMLLRKSLDYGLYEQFVGVFTLG